MANVATEPRDAAVGEAPDMSESHHTEDENAAAYLDGWALAFLVVAFMSISFVMALDNTALATAIPQITSDFHRLNDMGWYGSSSLIAQMALLPTCGRLYVFYNVKWTYCILLAVFELGCIIAAVAPSSAALIIGRAISGLGAAGLLSGATIVLSYYVAMQKRPLVLGIVLGMYSVGSAVGPLVGGAITDNKTLTWRFIFWINLPFGAIAMILVWFTLRRPPPSAKSGLPWIQKMHQLDFLGSILLLGAIVCLNLALQWGGIIYPWSNSKVFGSLIGFGLLLIAFLYWQARGKESALVPLHIFENRTVCVSCAFVLLMQLAMVSQMYYWPIYFQSVLNTSARNSGVYLLPIIISNSLGTLGAGWFSSRFRHYVPLMWIGAPILATGGGLFQLIRADSPAGQWIGVQIVSGTGFGICGQMSIMAVQVVLDKADTPAGLIMVLLFQGLGGALAPSIGQNIFTDNLLRNLSEVQGINASDVVAAGGSEFRKIVPPELMGAVVNAFDSALRDVFWVSLATPVLAWIVSWAIEWRRIPKDSKKAGTANVHTEIPTTRRSEK